MYMVEIPSDITVVIIPYFRNFIKGIGRPAFAAFSETITFAAAPIMVMFPPRQAPRDKLHQRG